MLIICTTVVLLIITAMFIPIEFSTSTIFKISVLLMSQFMLIMSQQFLDVHIDTVDLLGSKLFQTDLAVDR